MQPKFDNPVLVNSAGLAQALGVSLRTLSTLRNEPWFPEAIAIGPRSLRWNLSEVLSAAARRAPRTRVGEQPEPLRRAREQGERA
jgi:predicted DNA-binding transcriptional regulator AlpA